MLAHTSSPLLPGEEVVYVATTNMSRFYATIGCGVVVGFFFFLLPAVIMVVVALIQRDRFKNAECLVTTQRIIVHRWGNNRIVAYQHDEVASITRAGSLFKAVIIRGTDGRRVKLENVESDWELVEKAQEAISASCSGQP